MHCNEEEYVFKYKKGFKWLSSLRSGFGGLEVRVLAFGTQVRGFEPGRSRRIFRPKNPTASFVGEVKPSVPCRKFTACKRIQKWRGSRHFRQNSRQFLAHSSTFRYWGSLASPDAGDSLWRELERSKSLVLKVGGFDVSLATALCKNLPAENTQR